MDRTIASDAKIDWAATLLYRLRRLSITTVSTFKRIIAARSISIIGHPIIVTSGSILALTRRFGASPPIIYGCFAMLAIATGLMLWSRLKVTRGQWQHIDASNPHERDEWNKVAGTVLGLGAILAFGVHARALGLGLMCGAFILTVAIATRNRLKLSQHVAFATLSIFIAAYAGLAEATIFAALTIAVAWSRIVLNRHTGREVLAGAATGGLAGLALRVGLWGIV